jgi:flagellar basal-body rod protein FlgB
MRTLFDSVDRMEAALTFHRDRHAVLAGNVANLDTPGYVPLDLERPTPDVTVTAGPAAAMVTTNPRHIAGAAALDGGQAQLFRDPAGSVGADGNATSLEREMAKIAANRVRYATTSELTSRRLALLRYGAGDGQ